VSKEEEDLIETKIDTRGTDLPVACVGTKLTSYILCCKIILNKNWQKGVQWKN
jgi:hypothetical protein